VAMGDAAGFLIQYFERGSSFEAATKVTVSASEQPPEITFVLDPAVRRRSVRH
jgi:hypothetical protein